jgi:hypothetical protein
VFSINKIKLKLIKNFEKITHDKRNFHHLYYSQSLINKNFIFKYCKEIKLSNNSIDRIFRFSDYLNSKSNVINKKRDMWDLISSWDDHKSFMKVLSTHDKNSFLKIFQNYGKTKLGHGFSNYFSYEKLISSNIVKRKESYRFLDTLISLAEYKRLIKVYNPEQGGFLAHDLDYHELIRKIFVWNNKNILPFNTPNFLYGFSSNNQFYCFKDLKGFYTALKLNDLTNLYSLKELNEIGGGLGYVAYYFNLINNNNLNIYDIPITLLQQACCLLSTMSNDNIHLSGEPINKYQKISLRPYWEIFDYNTQDRILWFNQDSFPEIEINLCKKYIKKISSTKKSIFFSINQEADNHNAVDANQHSVHSLLSSDINFKLINRSRDFLRHGYIEELYSLGN